MAIQLTPGQTALLEKLAAAGNHPSPEAALDAALRLLDAYQQRQAELKQAIPEGAEAREAILRQHPTRD